MGCPKHHSCTFQYVIQVLESFLGFLRCKNERSEAFRTWEVRKAFIRKHQSDLRNWNQTICCSNKIETGKAVHYIFFLWLMYYWYLVQEFVQYPFQYVQYCEIHLPLLSSGSLLDTGIYESLPFRLASGKLQGLLNQLWFWNFLDCESSRTLRD